MPDKKLIDLETLTGVAPGDYLHILDVSDETFSPSGTDKKITAQDVVSTAILGSGSADERSFLRGDRTWGIPGTKWLVLPAGWDDCWRAALASSATTPCWVTVLGDSFAQGYVATDWISDSYVGLLASSLMATYGGYADFWPCTDSAQFVSLVGGGYSYGGTASWTISAAASWSFHGHSKSPYMASATATANLFSFTTPYSCTALDIVYYDYAASGSWDYAVDGGSAVTVSTNGSGEHKRISLTGLANTTHTVVFGNTVASNNMRMSGIATYKGSTGVGVAKLAYGGGKADDLATATATSSAVATNLDRALFYQGKTASAATGFGFPSQPHLAILAFGVNDAQVSVNEATFKQDISRYIQAFRRGRDDCSILIIASDYPTQSHDVTPSVAINSWPSYVVLLESVAASYGCGFASVVGRWSARSFAKGFTTATNQHPIDAGHADIAELVGSAIL